MTEVVVTDENLFTVLVYDRPIADFLLDSAFGRWLPFPVSDGLGSGGNTNPPPSGEPGRIVVLHSDSFS